MSGAGEVGRAGPSPEGESGLGRRSVQAGWGQRDVTTTDAWKLFALTFVLIDHYGLYFNPDEMWWRLFGRLASPVFFFFIGFARTRTVPWTWIAFGFAITAADYVTSQRDILINILLNFALVRLALPHVEAHVMPYPLRLAALAAACAALIPVLDPVLEYGGEGWLWALFGLSHRLLLAQQDAFALWRRNAVALTAGAAYIVREIHDYGFDALQSALLAVMIAAEVTVLMRFRRQDISWQPPRPLHPIFAFAGRRSLEIYALTLLAMQFLAFAIGGAAAEESEADDED